MIDMEVLSDVMTLLCCPNCKNPGLKLLEGSSKKMGLSSFLNIVCENCDHISDFHTSKKCGSSKSYDVNRRAVYTMRAIGQGFAGLEKFTSLMNMPKPMTQRNYDKIVKTISRYTKEVAEETMAEAVEEVKEGSIGVVDIGVSVDGSWQRRGYSSLNGVVTAISMTNGKILDCEPMSRICKACNLKNKLRKTNITAYENWKASHVCKLNYRGSIGGI